MTYSEIEDDDCGTIGLEVLEKWSVLPNGNLEN